MTREISLFRRRLRKLVRNPRAYVADSKALSFLKPVFPKLFKKEIDYSSKGNSIKEPEIQVRKNKKSPSVGSLYISDSVPSQQIKFITRLAAMASLSCKAGCYRLDTNECFAEIVIMTAQSVFSARLDLSCLRETKGQIILAKDRRFCEADPCLTDEISLKIINTLNALFWKESGDYRLLYLHHREHKGVTIKEIVQFGCRGGAYDQDLVQDISSIIFGYNSLSDEDCFNLFSKLYRILGTSELAGTVAKFLYGKRADLSARTVMLLAAFFCEAGDYVMAVKAAHYARQEDSDAWQENRYIGLSNFLYRERIVTDDWAKIDSFFYEKLSQNKLFFVDILDKIQKNGNFIIVGNSPCEIGLNKGRWIDENDCVVRFNSAVSEYPLSLDYGTKTDIVVLNPNFYQTRRNNKTDLSLIVISDGCLYSSRNLSYKLHDLSFEAPICLIPSWIDRELVSILHASPSSGMKILYWIYKYFGPIKKENIAGFSLSDQESGISRNYHINNDRHLPIIHDWSAEGNFLSRIVQV